MATNFGDLTKINRVEAKKLLEKKPGTQIYIVGSKVNYYHVRRGWCLGYPIEAETPEKLFEAEKDYLWYCDSELTRPGYAHFYVETATWNSYLKEKSNEILYRTIFA